MTGEEDPLSGFSLSAEHNFNAVNRPKKGQKPPFSGILSPVKHFFFVFSKVRN